MNAETIVAEFAKRGIEMTAVDATTVAPDAGYTHSAGLVVSAGEDMDGPWWEVARRDSVGCYARQTHRSIASAASSIGAKLGLW